MTGVSRKWAVAVVIASLLVLGALIEIRLGHLGALGVRFVVVIVFVALLMLIAGVSVRKR